MSSRLKAFLYLTLTALIWGAAGPVIKFTLKEIDPLPFLAYRMGISAVFSAAFFLIKIAKGRHFRNLRANFPLAALYGFLAVPVALGILFFGLDRSTVLDLTLIGVAGPILVTLGGAFFFHDHITHREKIGISVVILGVLLNSFSSLFGSPSSLRLTGNLLLFIFLFADAGSILLAKKILQKKVRSGNLANLSFIIGAIVTIPIALLVLGPAFINSIIMLPPQYHLGVWYMALLSGNLAYFLYVRGMRSIEVSEAVLFNYLQPVFTIPLAIFWLGESLSPSFIVGAAIIIIGLIIAERKKKRYNSH
jgi:drug/metabolite transporter (DMT)-like permease